jgi:hypothetical protein
MPTWANHESMLELTCVYPDDCRGIQRELPLLVRLE